ncbi:DUF1737 domain-containing protein [Paracoccus liaowanqingii]|uniref:DUF1737 domain-containing protein n=1 Tax=Paracoccus liaowanqingii TaxID=2560053 RepID=A0A4Z1CGK6_9RHOB|nr:DUF1737 domain-containing protein [Paracoccus liaowanqingii]TGN58612.1 DUF1737 domain-containing protein [Paracoccus liaowanqingii]
MTKAYRVITAGNLDNLQHLVEFHLSRGWELVGGANYSIKFLEGPWHQTLIHYDIDRKRTTDVVIG